MNRALAFGFTAVLALAGCGGKKDEKTVEKTPPAGSAAPVTAAGSGSAAMVASGSAAGSAVDVPTEEDFEGKAKTDISTANVDSKVKAIEDQLGQQ
jgi:hypothetical protein